LDALDIVPAPAFFDAVSAVEAAVHDPASPWRVLVHGDLGPHNVLLRSEGLVFLDFEFAHFGHGLVDAVGARLAFPQAFHGRCSHARAIRRLERAYRERLVTAVPEAGDDALFTTAIVQACAHWALSKLYGLWVVYLRERLAQGEAYDRQDGRTPERVVAFLGKVVAYIRAFLTTAEDAGQGSAVSTSLQQVVVALLTRWPSIAPLPMYPALESLGEP
jgi:hypothetical protein